MVPGGDVEQLVQGGRSVEHRGAVPAHRLAIDAFEMGLQLQLRLAAETDRDEVQACRRHLHTQALHGFPIAASEQGGLPSGLRQLIHGRCGQRLRIRHGPKRIRRVRRDDVNSGFHGPSRMPTSG